MTETVTPRTSTPEPTPGGGAGDPTAGRGPVLRIAVALACGLLGFVMVAQVRANEGLVDRLEAEREEDLARILSELSGQSDRLQSEITELRLTLLEYERSAEREELALRGLQRRFDDLRVLVGSVPAEGDGVMFTIADPRRLVTQDLLVDTVQELRDAGAEAIAVNDLRVVASSAFTTRNERLLLDRQPLAPPYRVAAIGPGDTMARALAIPGGAIDTLQVLADVEATVETRADLVLPAVAEQRAFVFGAPVTAEDTP